MLFPAFVFGGAYAGGSGRASEGLAARFGKERRICLSKVISWISSSSARLTNSQSEAKNGQECWCQQQSWTAVIFGILNFFGSKASSHPAPHQACLMKDFLRRNPRRFNSTLEAGNDFTVHAPVLCLRLLLELIIDGIRDVFDGYRRHNFVVALRCKNETKGCVLIISTDWVVCVCL